MCFRRFGGENRLYASSMFFACEESSENVILSAFPGIARIDEHQTVFAECGEDLLHRDQRAERVPIRMLVRDHEELVRAAELRERVLAIGPFAVFTHRGRPAPRAVP